MAAPIKKRVIEVIDDDNSSTPTFNSPVEDIDKIQPTKETDIVGKTFHVPMMDSQESGGGGGSPFHLATQPVVGPTKKRKVSLSPPDTLARNPPRRKSPRNKQSGAVDESQCTSQVAVNLFPVEGKVSTITTEKPQTKTTRKKGAAQNVGKENKESSSSTPPNDQLETHSNQEVNIPSKRNTTKTGKGAKAEPKPSTESAAVPDRKKSLSRSVVKSPIENNDGIPSDQQNSSRNISDSAEAKLKTKKKKRSFQDQLLELLFMSGKPYTVKMLAQQLQSTDSSIEFCLISLVDKGWVFKKEFASKSRSKELFWANQDAKNKELMDSLCLVPPQEIEQAQGELACLQREHTLLVNEITGITKAPSNTELNDQVQAMVKQVQELEQRLQETHARIRATESKPSKKPATMLSNRKQSSKPQSTKQIKKRINAMRLQWKTRKEKCMDFIEQLADGMEKKVKEVLNLLELETDEMVGVKIPPKHDDV